MIDNTTEQQDQQPQEQALTWTKGMLVDALAELSDEDAALVWAASRGTRAPEQPGAATGNGTPAAPTGNAFPSNWTV